MIASPRTAEAGRYCYLPSTPTKPATILDVSVCEGLGLYPDDIRIDVNG